MKPIPRLRAATALRQVAARLTKIDSRTTIDLEFRAVKADLDRILAELTGATVRLAGPDLNTYLDNKTIRVLTQAKARHEAVDAELDLLAGRVNEIKRLYEVHCEDQTQIVADLEDALSHAFERVCEPEYPYREPEPRSTRRGGAR